MATFASAQTGNWSATTTWVGGVVPALGDKITIATGHTVTVDTTSAVCGDDTTTALTVNGTLKASRTVNSALRVRGDLVINTGTLNYGTVADPIPDTVTATLFLNDSATPAGAKYGLRTNTNAVVFGGIHLRGATKTRLTSTVGAYAAGTTAIQLADTSGWKVGDRLIFAPTDGSPTTYFVRTVAAIAGTSVTLNSDTPADLADAHYVMNTTCNVRIRPYNYLYSQHILFNCSASQPANTVTWQHAEFVGASNGGTPAAGFTSVALATIAGNPSTSTANPHPFVNPVMPVFVAIDDAGVAGGTAPAFNVAGFRTTPRAGRLQVTPFVHWPNATTVSTVRENNANSIDWVDPVIIGCSRGFSLDGSRGSNFYRPKIIGSRASAIYRAAGTATYVEDAEIESCAQLANIAGTGDMLFSGGKFHKRYGTAFSGEPMSAESTGTGAVTVLNGQFGTGCDLMAQTRTLWQYVDPSAWLAMYYVNGDPTVHREQRRGGVVSRDNAVFNRSSSSMKMTPAVADLVCERKFQIAAPPGTSTIKCGVRYNAAYNGSAMPSLTISGGNMAAPVSFTAAAGQPDVWQEFVLTPNNPGQTNQYTLTFSCNGTAGDVYFDGLPLYPFVDNCRHYGYRIDESNPLRVADPNIVIDQSTALARPVTVDHVAQTITVSGVCTNQQVYHACMANLCQPANISRPIHISSADGVSFVTTYTVAFSGSGSILGSYTDAVGVHVMIEAPALVSGTRVQVYNVSTQTEMFNGVLGINGLSIPATFSIEQTVRLRADHPSKLALTSLGTLTSSGLTFLDIQADDTVYTGNGIDGSTVTEFAADGPNIQIDINDPDGITTVQRLYAWMQHYQTTAVGIASPFFGAMTAIDSANYVVDQSLVDLKLDNVNAAVPLRVIGGYFSRKDGSSVIAPSSYSIQMDPGKAYVASGAVNANVDPATVATAVWGATTRTLTVASGLTNAQEAVLNQIQTKIDATL